MRKLTAILFCIYSQILYCQSPLSFYHISNNIGLSGKFINCTAQDDKGFIWIACNSGLFRYDGNKLLNVSKDLKSNLVFTGINKMQSDNKGNLWLLEAEKIGVLNTNTFQYRQVPTTPTQSVLIEKHSKVMQLCTDLDGRIYLAQQEYGVAVYNEAERKFTTSVPFKFPAKWPIGMIRQDPKTYNYLFSSDSGIAIYDFKTREVYTHSYNPKQLGILKTPLNYVSDFIVDNNRKYWIAYWSFNKKNFGKTLLCFDETKQQFTDESSEVNKIKPDFGNFFQDSQSRMWTSGWTLLYRPPGIYQPVSVIQNNLSYDYAINYNQINDVMEDREKNVWISTDRGLYILYPKSFNTVNSLSPGINVNAFYENNPNEIWVANWGSGVQVYDSNLNLVKYDFYKSIKKPEVPYSLAWTFQRESGTDHLWVGCQHAGIQIIDVTKKKTLQWLHPDIFDNKTIRHIREDKNGNLWFGTQKGSLVVWTKGSDYSDSSFELVYEFGGIISAMYADDKNNIWVGTEEKGLFVVDAASHKITHHFTSFTDKGKALGNEYVRGITQLNDSIYVMLGFGLNFINLKTGTIKVVDARQGMPDIGGSSLIVDKNQNIWMSFFESVANYNSNKEIFSLYGMKEGITLVGTPQTMFLSSTGKIYTGGFRVLNSFYPSDLQKEESLPHVAITEFHFLDKYLRTDSIQKLRRLNFAYDQSSFTISFSSLSYSLNDKLTYYYKLDGADKYWIRANEGSSVSYNLLPAGYYNFMVRCVNEKGVFSDITSLHIYVRPPFWLTWWFIVLCALVVAAIIYFVYHLNIKRILAVEHVRQRVARDLHDDMGSTLSTINILSTMAKTKLVEDPIKTGEYISKISDNSSRMMETMDDIVWSINPYNDSLNKVITRMRAFATEMLEAKEIELSFKIDSAIDHAHLNMEQRRDLFLIYKEIINNAAKYSHATRVYIEMKTEKKNLQLSVQDNGVGFVLAEVDSGNGLNNMQKRAIQLNGELSIQSQPSKGTIINLQIPLG